MNENKANLQLVAITSDNGTIQLNNYDKLVESAKQFVEQLSMFKNPTDEEEVRLCKKERTELNRVKKQLTDTRLTLTDFYMGKFIEQVKELEHIIDVASREHTEALKHIEEQQKELLKSDVKPIVKLKIIAPDEATALKIKKYAQKLGSTVFDIEE